jgi:serine/threonine-protein kinase
MDTTGTGLDADACLAALGVTRDDPRPIDETIRADHLALTTTLRGRRLAAPTAPLPLIEFTFASTTATTDTDPSEVAVPDLVVEDKLGEGGMGTVFRGRQRALDREVAVKLPHDGSSAESASALLHEALLAGALEHPNIVPVHALGRGADGRPVLVMKRVDGVAWRDLIHDDEHPYWDRPWLATDDRLVGHLKILQKVCQALEFAHSRGVIHRDVKPDNVMIGVFGEVYLIDWGIAFRAADEAGSSTHLVGTPAYVAPEMVVGTWRDIDPRTDVYLLGATLHEVLTRKLLHEGTTVAQALRHALRSPPYAYGPETPPELAALVTAATCRDPDDRPSSAFEFHARISQFLGTRGSVGLTRAAIASLDAVRKMLRRRADRTALSDAEAGRLLVECRFGFLEAMRAWDGNIAARSGLQECLELMVERQLLWGNAIAARSIARELSMPRPALLAEIEALEDEIARARSPLSEARIRVGSSPPPSPSQSSSERAQQSERIAFDTPSMPMKSPLARVRPSASTHPPASVRTRGTFAAIALVVVIGPLLVDLYRTRSSAPDPLLRDALWLAGVSVLGVVGGRAHLALRACRTLWALALVVLCTQSAIDALAIAHDLPAALDAQLDLVTLASGAAVAAATLARRLVVALAVAIAGLVVSSAAPAQAPLAASTSIAIALLLLLDEAQRMARNAASEPLALVSDATHRRA